MVKRFDRWLAPIVGVALLCTGISRAEDGESELYRWLDRNGVVRYTPDLSRIPETRRSTSIRVVPGSTPRGEPLSASLPGASSADPLAAQTLTPLGPALAGADPFNSPGEARQVEAEQLAAGADFGGNTWPELDARIAELEILIYADEEIIKDMISAPPSVGSDDLIHSPELREIAARLPILQGELNELRRWREQPRDR